MAKKMTQVFTASSDADVQNIAISGMSADLYAVKADDGNSGKVYIGNDGSDTVSPTTGMSFVAGSGFQHRGATLDRLHVHFETSGDKVAVMAVS